MLRVKGKLVYESWELMGNGILVVGWGGSNVSCNEVDENEAVTLKMQGHRTEIRNRRLSLMTRSVMGVVACVPRIGNGTAWMRRRGGQVLRETLGVCIEQDGASPF